MALFPGSQKAYIYTLTKSHTTLWGQLHTVSQTQKVFHTNLVINLDLTGTDKDSYHWIANS